MSKRVFIVHGWDGYPEEGWFPWLARELETKGFEVSTPFMPHSSEPKITEWVPFLKMLVGDVDRDTYFVGHSIGCQTILRLLEKEKKEVGGAIFVGGWFVLSEAVMKDKESAEIAKPWLETPIDFEKIRKVLPTSIAIFSHDDPLVPLDNAHPFAEELDSEIFIEHGMGHFSGDDGVIELPIVLESLLALAK